MTIPVIQLVLAAAFAEPFFVPVPEKSTCDGTVEIRLDDTQTIRVSCAEDAEKAAEWVDDHLKEWFDVARTGWFGWTVNRPRAAVGSAGEAAALGDEAYELIADESGVELRAKTMSGVRYGLYTLRQLAMANRGTERVEHFVMPKCRVVDSPAFAFRGLHLCWFPETSMTKIERMIRLAAYCKFNCVIIEPWGVYRWKSHPEFCWPDASVDAGDIGRLVRLGRDLGVAICPQVNVFGHATMSRFVNGKHTTLDVHPSLQTIFEPVGGWNWCLSNPATRRVLTDMVNEMIDAFDNPPYFHLGCDEAEEPNCPECRARPYAQVVGEHLLAMRKVVMARGARAMMWHDMLLDSAEKKWKPFYARGTAETAKLLDILPKDVVICDWFYDGPQKTYPTFGHFKSRGFDVVTCPWTHTAGTVAQGRAAKEERLFGVLATTWHYFEGYNVPQMMVAAANAAWGRGGDGDFAREYRLALPTMLRQVGWDMKLDDREDTGYGPHDVMPYQPPK